jgi:hypothetical protein
MPYVNYNSKWFHSYCRALLEEDPNMARVYVREAQATMARRLRDSDVDEDERCAISLASRYLNTIAETDIPKAC